MGRRTGRLSFGAAAALVAAAGFVLLGGCPSPAASSSNKICTPGAYVYCRCENRLEGTKLCGDAGNAFADCNCAGSNGNGTGPPPGYLQTDAGHERIDAALPPNPGPRLDAACGGKLAVIASTEQEDPQDKNRPLDVFGAAYQADGTWVVGKSQGGPLRGEPHGGLVGSTLVVVWKSAYELIGWTKFDANQKDVLPFLSLGSAYTTKSPAFVGATANGRIYSQGVDDAGNDDNTLHEGIYSPATGWDDATNPLVPAGPSAIMSAPGAALTASGYVVAYASFPDTASSGSVVVQAQSSGTWGTPAAIDGATVQTGTTPLLTALGGGTDDLLLVYVGSDFALHYASRKAGDATLGAVALVDPAAVPDADAALTAMSKGRAMLAWKAVNGSPFYSVYDPSQSPKWTSPAAFFDANPRIAKAPSVGTGKCAGDADAAYLDQSGQVYVAVYAGTKWTGPFLVPALSNMTWTGVGEVP
jgi:hypothetical protein